MPYYDSRPPLLKFVVSRTEYICSDGAPLSRVYPRKKIGVIPLAPRYDVEGGAGRSGAVDRVAGRLALHSLLDPHGSTTLRNCSVVHWDLG